MSKKMDVMTALELCGFTSGDRQESRLMNLLSTILKLQSDPPVPLSFGEIYEQLLRDEPKSTLTKAWVHRVLKSLVEVKLIRLESPTSHRKRYIADVNTVMAGLEQLKSKRINELEEQRAEISDTLDIINGLECGVLAQEFVKRITGTQQKVSSRTLRGVDELHRVLKEDGWIFLLSHMKPSSDTEVPARYRLLADDMLVREDSDLAPVRRWTHNTRDIERALAGFSIQGLHLQRTQMREFVACKAKEKEEVEKS